LDGDENRTRVLSWEAEFTPLVGREQLVPEMSWSLRTLDFCRSALGASRVRGLVRRRTALLQSIDLAIAAEELVPRRVFPGSSLRNQLSRVPAACRNWCRTSRIGIGTAVTTCATRPALYAEDAGFRRPDSGGACNSASAVDHLNKVIEGYSLFWLRTGRWHRFKRTWHGSTAGSSWRL